MVTTFDTKPSASAPETSGGSGGSGGTGGPEGRFAIEIEHQVTLLSNEAKQEGVPIVGHVLEGMDNVGDGGGPVADPFAQFFSSGFGWMIDKVGFLRDAIDELDGDAAAGQTAVDSMKQASESLSFMARGHQADITSLQDWQGDAGEAYRASMKQLHEEILGLMHVVHGLGTLTAVTISMVITLRKIVRELVATVLGAIVIIMLAAVAAAVWTFGTSIAVGLAASMAAAAVTAVESARRITMLMDALGRQTERMVTLETIAEEIADSLKRYEKAAGLSTTQSSKDSDPQRWNSSRDKADEIGQDTSGRLGAVTPDARREFDQQELDQAKQELGR
ncbi:hypothetical protein [Saccharothrix ecbatanensis]|uniref:hypothetical protein n=1 Tax=Saccharothrix ecbatanensis TaxID=1105145 RepID=UPI001610B389|nr:hypothetical protein [Saccharothrix ecbatanensis]